MSNARGGYKVGPITAPSQARNMPWTASLVQEFAIGAKMELDDGRIYRYTHAGTTQLEKALMCQSAITPGNWLEIVQTGKAAAIGATVFGILISTGSTFVAHDWDEGWLIVNKVTGLNEVYSIASHTVHDTDPFVTILDPGGIRVAFTATSEISIKQNLWKKTIVHPVTTATGSAVGVPAVAIAASSYGWLQTRGPCAMTVDTTDTLVIGEAVGLPGTNAVAGAVGNPTDSIAGNVWGRAISIGAGDETALVYLDLE